MKTLREIIMLGVFFTTIVTTTALNGQELDRTKRPAGKPAPKVTLPEIQKATVKNGLNVWLVERHELPTVAFNLVIQAGSDHDPVSQPGLASMTAAMMDEGTKSRTALEISDEVEAIGASFGVNSSTDGSYITMSTLAKHLDKALAVFTDVLTNPTFPQKEFARIQKQRITMLLQQHDQPVSIANNVFSYVLYGPDHPYGNNPTGTEASIKAMTTDNLVKFYQTYYRPNNATLIVVGDVKLGDVTSRLETALGNWTTAAVPAFSVPEPKPMDKMRVYLVDKPGAPQSEIRIGYPSLARNTPDYFPVIVMNRLLGGQFTSRINLNLRERHGYTYGARSAFSFQKGVGPFTASAGVVTEKTDSSLHEFLYELNQMRVKGMTAEELAYVKEGLVGNFALNFETSAQIASSLQNIVLYGLPENYYQNYLQNIDGVTLDAVNRVAKKYLDASTMAAVVVGDLSKIKESVAALKLGDVVVCDVSGKPVQ